MDGTANTLFFRIPAIFLKPDHRNRPKISPFSPISGFICFSRRLGKYLFNSRSNGQHTKTCCLSLSISIADSPDKLADILIACIFIKTGAVGLYGFPCIPISEYARVKRPSPALKGLDLVDFAEPVLAIEDAMSIDNFHLHPITFLDAKFPEKASWIKIQKRGYGILFSLRQGDRALSVATVSAEFTGKNILDIHRFRVHRSHRIGYRIRHSCGGKAPESQET